METLENLFSWIFLIAFITTIIFGVMWFKNRKDVESKKYTKNKKFTLISLVVLIVAFIGFQVTPSDDNEDDTADAKTEQASRKASSKETNDSTSDDSLSKKRLSELEKEINDDLGSDDTGSTSWGWNEDEGAWVATLDSNCNMYADMEDGQVSVWNAYVREVQEISKAAKGAGSSDYSRFELKNPSDTRRSYLIVEDGKVKYNVGEDLD